MKPLTLTLTLLTAGVLRISAQITADIAVAQAGGPLGTITVELDHLNAPMATANFIGLATGKFAWIDSATGVVRRNTPYYDGIIFHRVIDGFMNQTGSQNGQGTDGPGYSFQDGSEVTNGLDHSDPYTLSMANSGPNTNGSQFFITVEPTPWLDGKHIVFGKVAATGNSRSIADQINNLPTDSEDRPVDEIRIASITVDYNGVDFDPCAQGLPVVSTPALGTPVTPSTTTLDFTQPVGSAFHLAYSDDLTDWTQTSTRQVLADDSPLSSFTLPAAATGNSRLYFSPALVTYDPDFLMPSDLANRTFSVIVTTYSATVPIVFNFDATGRNATWSWPPPFDLSGTATIFSGGSYNATLFSATVILDLTGINVRYWQFNNLDLSGSGPTQVTGTHDVTLYFPDSTPTFPGTFTLTK